MTIANNQQLLDEINAYNQIRIEMTQNGERVALGHPADVREKIEELIAEKLEIAFVSLQEDVEDGEYFVYVHTDTYEELDQEDVDKLEALDIDESEEGCTEAIKKFLEVEFRFVTETVIPCGKCNKENTKDMGNGVLFCYDCKSEEAVEEAKKRFFEKQ